MLQQLQSRELKAEHGAYLCLQSTGRIAPETIPHDAPDGDCKRPALVRKLIRDRPTSPVRIQTADMVASFVCGRLPRCRMTRELHRVPPYGQLRPPGGSLERGETGACETWCLEGLHPDVRAIQPSTGRDTRIPQLTALAT